MYMQATPRRPQVIPVFVFFVGNYAILTFVRVAFQNFLSYSLPVVSVPVIIKGFVVIAI